MLADLAQRLGDDLADLLIRRRYSGNLDHLLQRPPDWLGHPPKEINGLLGGGVNALLHQHRVFTGDHMAVAFPDDLIGKHGGRGSAVPRSIICLASRLAKNGCTNIFRGIIELDFISTSNSVMDYQSPPIL